MSPSNSSATSSDTIPGEARKRLVKGKMNSFSRHSMVDAVPASNAASSPPVGKPTHGRASSFLGFSFRGRTNSSPQQSATLPTVREGGANGSTDEFGASRPSLSSRANTVPNGTNNANTTTNDSSAAPMGNPTQQQGQPQPAGPGRQLHPEIRSIVQLSTAQAHKVYFSGPLVKHNERQPDGRIVGKEEPWREVWAQLGGTTLSVWGMKEIEEANRRGGEVPPSYLNITDASINVLGAVTMPGPDGNPVKYANVITLTNAGLNLTLFSCPAPQALVSWTAALRLAAYEKSRLEEIYTAHLLRMSLSEQGVWKDPRSPLVNNRMEGWVKIRINGQTDWKRLWMVAQAGQNEGGGGVENAQKNRLSALFGRASHEHQAGGSSSSAEYRPPNMVLYSSQRPRDQKRPLLTFTNVSQVFAVYPERPELISRSTLIKMEGYIGEEELAGEWRAREGWLLMMPETETGKMGSLEMLKWLVGLHDAFSLYGRPNGYSWNPRDPNSLMFAYPIGPRKDNLFLDRELVEHVDPREDRGSAIRQKFKAILLERMYGPNGADGPSRISTANPTFGASAPPSLPPIQSVTEHESQEDEPTQQNGHAAGGNSSFQLPPLSFDNAPARPVRSPPSRGQAGDGSLSPITERSYEPSTRASTQEHPTMRSPPSASSAASGSGGGAALSASQSLRQNFTHATIEEEGAHSGQRVESPDSNAIPFEEYTPQQSRASTQATPEQQETQFHPQPPQQKSSSFGTVKSASRFSIDSPGSAGAARLPRMASPPRDMRSPPLSTHSSQTGADPATMRLPASTTSSTTAPTIDRALSPSSSTSMRFSISGPSQGTSVHQDLEHPPHSPGSHMSHSTMLTSPFSMVDTDGSPGTSKRFSAMKEKDKESISEANEDRPPPPPAKSPLRPSFDPQQYKPKVREPEYVFNEPGAMYYMNQQQQEGKIPPPPPLVPPAAATWDEDEGEASESEDQSMSTQTRSRSMNSSRQQDLPPVQTQQEPAQNVPPSPVHRRQTPMGFEVVSGHVGVGSSERPGSREQERLLNMHLPAHDPHLGRRPSGARAPPARVTGKRFIPSDNTASAMPHDVDEHPQTVKLSMAEQKQPAAPADVDDHTVDALAALSFLEQQDGPVDAPSRARAASSTSDKQKASVAAPQPPQILEPEDRAPSPPGASSQQQYRSSFAPSKSAAERKARSQAQQAAHDAAVHTPGRPNGRQRAKQREGGWESSEDEDEEEDEEDDDDEISDRDEPTMPRTNSGPSPPLAAPVGRAPVQQQQLQQQVRGLSLSTSGSAQDVRDQLLNQQRPMRTLPQIPRGRSPGGSDRRYAADQFQQYPQQQYQQQQPHVGPAHQNMWTTNLERDPGMMPPSQSSNNRDTFVQLESPADTMTKAFTPQGLLSAGLQDKQDRSAKRQEELARESGASLINVPNKPPPPQVGLLGAITAHERERKREGGMGAALTEREREKRLAEERQRRLDELQRQQLEQQQQLAAQFGGNMGMYGQTLSPQMTGMNPMMSGYFPQMMGGPQSMYFNPMFPMMGNPQHMYAAQHAAQAYQQAMIAMSQAGSQIGGEGGNGGSPIGTGRASPNVNMGMGMGMPGTGSPPPGMGGMPFDPRMSMAGMPMMSPMPMNMMGMGMPGMGMQGMSGPGSTMGGMDPRLSLGPGAFDGGGGSPGHGMSSGQHSRVGTSYNNSPSPAASPAPQSGAPEGART